MAIQYTPSLGLPYPEVTDAPLIASRDLRGLALKMDSEGAQTRGESSAALSAAIGAEATADQALARANAIEEPIYTGTGEPSPEQDLRVNWDADAPGDGVTSEDITDATTVGRAVLTAPLSVDARNALSIFTGSRALLDAGTDTAERTWDAKELHEYVTDQVAAGGGAASWDDLTGKPTTFPPATHTHDDRYYTEAEVDALIADAAAQDTGWIITTPTGYAIDPGNDGTLELRRIGDSVYCRFNGLMVAAGSLDEWLVGNGIPTGFRVGEYGAVHDVAGGYVSQPGMNGATRHRLTIYSNDIRYIGQIHGATTTEVTPARDDQSRRIYGWLPAWITDDPFPM